MSGAQLRTYQPDPKSLEIFSWTPVNLQQRTHGFGKIASALIYYSPKRVWYRLIEFLLAGRRHTALRWAWGLHPMLCNPRCLETVAVHGGLSADRKARQGLPRLAVLAGNSKPRTITLEPVRLSRTIKSEIFRCRAGATPFIPRATQSQALHPLGGCIREPNIESPVDPPHNRQRIRHQFGIFHVHKLSGHVGICIAKPDNVVQNLPIFRTSRIPS
jgi:hypothetical protein